MYHNLAPCLKGRNPWTYVASLLPEQQQKTKNLLVSKLPEQEEHVMISTDLNVSSTPDSLLFLLILLCLQTRRDLLKHGF